ncbi:hypothetical protein GW17_00051447 [Ensete ventricosum]|nr:hypothetical protein GW17_00051447 [Ensete ventricosum]
MRSVARGQFLCPHDPSLAEDFFSSCGEKKCLPMWGEGTRRPRYAGMVQKRLSDFMLAAFQQCPKFIALLKVARSRNIDRRVWRRACDYLGLMSEPAICLSILGPSTEKPKGSGIINWSEGGSKMIAHVPFYILSEQEG